MRWLHGLRDASLLGASAGLLGVISLAARLDIPWVPATKDEAPALCGDDGTVLHADPGLPRIAVAECRRRLESVVFVDARSSEVFASAHIPGAISLPADEIDTVLASQSLPIPTDGELVMYCDRKDGGDAEYVGRALGEALGCQSVRVLEGGWQAWLDAAGPVEGAQQSG